MAKKDSAEEKCQCGCGQDLNQEECGCGHENCTCGENCECTAENKCCEECTCGETKQEKKDYLNDLLRVQAEFDNYRKRMTTALGDARQDGFTDAIVQFLPALDSFKMATEYIQDQNTLMGIKFIEKGILDTLSKMGVQEIDATGKFDPNLHQAVETDSSSDVESGYIVKEMFKGFTYKDKVIRYSQVIVKK